MKEVELKVNFWKIGGIEVPREDGQSFEVGKWQMLWKRPGYVTCWQLQKGRSGDKARKIHRTISWSPFGSKGPYLSSQSTVACFEWKSHITI